MSDVNRRLLQFIDPNQFKNQNINKISDFVPKTVRKITLRKVEIGFEILIVFCCCLVWLG